MVAGNRDVLVRLKGELDPTLREAYRNVATLAKASERARVQSTKSVASAESKARRESARDDEREVRESMRRAKDREKALQRSYAEQSKAAQKAAREQERAAKQAAKEQINAAKKAAREQDRLSRAVESNRNKAEYAQKKLIKTSEKLVDAGFGLARSGLLLGLLGSEQDTQKFLQTFVKIEAGIDLLRGGVHVWRLMSQAVKQYNALLAATKAAETALAAAQATRAATGAAASFAGAGIGAGAAVGGGVVGAASTVAPVALPLAMAALLPFAPSIARSDRERYRGHSLDIDMEHLRDLQSWEQKYQSLKIQREGVNAAASMDRTALKAMGEGMEYRGAGRAYEQTRFQSTASEISLIGSRDRLSRTDAEHPGRKSAVENTLSAYQRLIDMENRRVEAAKMVSSEAIATLRSYQAQEKALKSQADARRKALEGAASSYADMTPSERRKLQSAYDRAKRGEDAGRQGRALLGVAGFEETDRLARENARREAERDPWFRERAKEQQDNIAKGLSDSLANIDRQRQETIAKLPDDFRREIKSISDKGDDKIIESLRNLTNGIVDAYGERVSGLADRIDKLRGELLDIEFRVKERALSEVNSER